LFWYNTCMKIKGFQDTIEWYNEHAQEYANANINPQQDVLEKFITMLPPHPKILDVGCGPGRDAEFFHTKGADVIGLDISKGLLKIAKERNPTVTFIEGNFLDLPFNDQTFDGVWSQAAFVHLESIADVKKTLAESYRVLKKEGIINVYVKEQRGTHKTEIVDDIGVKAKRFFRYFTKDEMEGYMKKVGFTLKDVTIRNSRTRKGLTWICIFAEK
jgi:ubiquinone/menaquinone biosynthesis C-methylase UbiE